MDKYDFYKLDLLLAMLEESLEEQEAANDDD